MRTISLLVLVALVGFAPSIAAQSPIPLDYFEPEVGSDILLSNGPEIPVWMPGFVRIHFTFQSDITGQGGGYVAPSVKVCYSVRPVGMTAAECASLELNWVHGQDGRWPDVEILDFSTTTGIGVAKALLPINILDERGTWGHLMLDADVVKIFWGWHSGDLIHPITSEPSAFEGTKQLVLNTFQDEYCTEIIQNRMMWADVPSTVRLNARDISSEDRVFSVYSEVSNLFQCPSTVTLPADHCHVSFTVTPRELGSGRLIFVLQEGNTPGTPVYSQTGFAKRKPERYPWDGDDPYEEPGFPSTPIRMNSDCHHAKVPPSTPSGSEWTVCGPCDSGVKSSQDCWSFGGAGSSAYQVIPFYCDWFAVFNNCVHDPNGAQLSVQGYTSDSTWVEPCGIDETSGEVNIFDIIVFGASSTETKSKQCCLVKATSNTKTIQVNDCN